MGISSGTVVKVLLLLIFVMVAVQLILNTRQLDCPTTVIEKVVEVTREKETTEATYHTARDTLGDTDANRNTDHANGDADTNRDSHYLKKFFGGNKINLATEKFTLLMLTYKRPHLDKILIVWNDVATPIPADVTQIPCAAKLEFIVPPANKLSNRYYPFKEIETQGVAIIDDDRKVLINDLVFGFKVWQQYRFRIVGYEERMHTMSEGNYVYGPLPNTKELGYSIMISTAHIIHKAYMEMFNDPLMLPEPIHNYIDQKMNCEDLAMCIMVTGFLSRATWPQSCAIAVKPIHVPYNLEAQGREGYRGLSMRKNHSKDRSVCLNDFRTYYPNNTLPLVYTNARVVYHPGKDWYVEDGKNNKYT